MTGYTQDFPDGRIKNLSFRMMGVGSLLDKIYLWMSLIGLTYLEGKDPRKKYGGVWKYFILKGFFYRNGNTEDRFHGPTTVPDRG